MIFPFPSSGAPIWLDLLTRKTSILLSRLSYLITSILYAVVLVEASTLKRSAQGMGKTGPIALPYGPLGNNNGSDNVPLLAEDGQEGDDVSMAREE
jgi:hypothetical protein